MINNNNNINHTWNKIARNLKVGDIFFCREEPSMNNRPLGRVIAIQEGNNDFVWSVNIVVGTNASKTFETQILEQPPVNKLVLLVESKNENNIEQ